MIQQQLPGGDKIVIVCTEKSDGDFRVPPEGKIADQGLELRRQQITSHRWFWIRQQHRAEIATVGTSETEATGNIGGAWDACITSEAFTALSVTTADCLSIALWGTDRGIGVIHAGWRGLRLGIIEKTITAMKHSFGEVASAFIGPHICAGCYEFSPKDAQDFVKRWGSDVYLPSGASGRLDLALIAKSSLREAGVNDVANVDSCTACESERWFSYRARQEEERMAMVAWREQA